MCNPGKEISKFTFSIMSTMAFKVVILTFLLAPFTLALPQSAAKPVASPPPIGGSNAPGTGHGEFSLPGTGNVGPGSVTGYGPHILHAGEVYVWLLVIPSVDAKQLPLQCHRHSQVLYCQPSLCETGRSRLVWSATYEWYECPL